MLIGSRCHQSSRSDLLPLNPFAQVPTVAPSPTLCSLAVSAEHGLHCWIIRWMRSLESAAPAWPSRVSSGLQGRPLPGWRSRTRWIIGREPLVFCPDHLPGSRSCGGRDVLRDGPQKRRHLAGNCGNDQRTLFAGGGEPTVTGAQGNLRLPGDCANRFGQTLEPRLQGLADAGRMAIAPSTLDQHPPGTFVASQCETAPPNPLAG